MPADPGHRPVAVAAPRAAGPGRELRLDIGRALPGDGGDTRLPGARLAVAGGALRAVERRRAGDRRRRGEAGIILRDRELFLDRQGAGDRAHLRVGANPLVIMRELADEITFVEPGEPRAEIAVALARDPVARQAGIGGAGIAARQRDHLAGLAVAGGTALVGRAAGEQGEKRQGGADRHRAGNRPGGRAVPTIAQTSRAALAALACALAACKPAPTERFPADPELAARGKAAIERAGCAACHAIPGIAWPQGRLGPSLADWKEDGWIAGALPATPETLAAFLRNAPAAKPGTTMPAMPVSERDSRAMAHYLIGESR